MSRSSGPAIRGSLARSSWRGSLVSRPPCSRRTRSPGDAAPATAVRGRVPPAACRARSGSPGGASTSPVGCMTKYWRGFRPSRVWSVTSRSTASLSAAATSMSRTDNETSTRSRPNRSSSTRSSAMPRGLCLSPRCVAIFSMRRRRSARSSNRSAPASIRRNSPSAISGWHASSARASIPQARSCRSNSATARSCCALPAGR